MRAIIIEDEPRASRRLESLLNEISPEITILDKLESIGDCEQFFTQNHQVDVIFSDIELADGLSFDAFKSVADLPPIIFTTAYDQYAIKAFKSNGIDYLLKPVDKIELQESIEKLKSFTKPIINPDILSVLASQINTDSNTYKDRFLIKVGQHLKSISINQIHAFYSLDKATYTFTSEGRNYIIDHSLEYLEEHLDPKQFFRINRHFILSINAPIDIVAWSNSRLKIELSGYSGDMIIVSRNKTKEFKHWLGDS